MSKLTLDVPIELKAILERHPKTHWERVAEKALWSYARKVQLADQIASRSALTETATEAIGREVKAALRRRYSKAAR
ncbi:MAG: hypothetical protein HY278_02385 [candidate division NC10 bacterium]|nr:hypothetical protein [candidate division NC10 bacterium]